jgi:uncharacterized flavoprotein (TIGR03862 family)
MISDEGNPVHAVAVVGGGPAGLMAAETLIRNGHVRVDVYDAMPSVARKFLLAGKGGLNLTHAEPFQQFISRYAGRRGALSPLLEAFDADALRAWARELGTETFVGTSGRVFPVGMKAAPLLRAWLHRLRSAGVHFHMRHRWSGWEGMEEGGALRFATPQGDCHVRADAVVLALGGGSWARLGSDGAWVALLSQRGVPVARLRPANCGFDVADGGWSAHFRERFAGQPVKSVQAEFVDAQGVGQRRQGEFVVTETGVEGSLIYAMSAALRDEIEAHGMATLTLDLAPDWTQQRVFDEVSRPRGSRSLSSHLQSRLNLKGVKTGLLRELIAAPDFADPPRLAAAIKALPLRLGATRPLDEAISSAGGVTFEALDENLMIRTLPGVFCAGEMLDWEAPTGGYLLTACFATGRAAGLGVLRWQGLG